MKELQSLALDIKVLDKDDNEIILRESIDDEPEDLPVNIAGVEDEDILSQDAEPDDGDDLLDDMDDILGEDEDDDIAAGLDAILGAADTSGDGEDFQGDYLDSDDVKSLEMMAEEEDDFDDDDGLF